MTQDITAILLPAARIDFFVMNDVTAETAQDMSEDWRFARVNVTVTRADIATAATFYATNASPEIIIIETEDISDAFIQQLGGLAGVCGPNTDAVIIGPMNDVHLYRSLVGMGVRDYLVRPVSQEDLIKVMAKSLIEKRGLAGARLVTVIGSKGGVGTTAIAQTLAWSIAENFGQKTMLTDAAGASGTLGVAYAIEPATTLTEGVRIGISGSDDDLKRIVQTVTDQLSLLVFGNDPILTESPDPDSVEAMVNRVLVKNPVIVMDLSGAAPAVQKRMLARSTHVILVTTPLLSALRNARTLLNEIKHIRGGLKEVELLVNMQGIAASEEVPAADIKKVLDMEPAATIPFLPKIFSGGETSGKPLGKNPAADGIFKTIDAIASRASATETKMIDIKPQKDPFAFLKSLGRDLAKPRNSTTTKGK